jgi:hypothetical protein
MNEALHRATLNKRMYVRTYGGNRDAGIRTDGPAAEDEASYIDVTCPQLTLSQLIDDFLSELEGNIPVDPASAAIAVSAASATAIGPVTVGAEVDADASCSSGSRAVAAGLTPQAPLRIIAILKVDVEGDELAVLRGVRRRHWALVDRLLVETHPALEAAVREWLAVQGFRVGRSDGSAGTGAGAGTSFDVDVDVDKGCITGNILLCARNTNSLQ